ncbi:protein S40-5 [Corylus avellana]|uniref:protein S40-5 n=1 Tax=Corylus avellana TaxID=13451 RepID=UPI001E212CBC|nr:protein S40-5 [Corylus avellana]XP_059440406.1 protein S40-5 [Corylus avellana]
MADRKGIMGKSSGFGGSSRRDEDFEEEDVWSLIKERKPKEHSSASSSSAWRLPSAPRMIPRVYTPPTHEACRVVQQSSAPVDIPDWSKIYGKNAKIDSRRPGSWVDDDGDDDGTAVSNGVAYHNDDDDDDDDNDDGDMVPPHEWIARKLARSQISSFSVCEGIGRTLKGRDLSKVRNAILTKTGFLE